MRIFTKILLTGLFVGMPFLSITSQTTLILVDSKTSEPVSFAHVCFESLDKSVIQNIIADEKGLVTFPENLPFQLAATAIGYTTLIDTFKTAGKYTLYMEHSIIDMEGVVVTAQYSPQRADQSIYNVGVIDNRLIRQKGAVNLSQALNNELGIQIKNDGALGSSLKIQGLEGEHVKILIDGVPVLGRMDGNIDLSQINMYNVDHIEVVEGPMSVVYGSNALAGAINIITKENHRQKLAAWANSHIESVGVYNFDVGGSAGFGKSSVSLTGSRNFFSGFSDPDTSRSMQWKPKLQYNLDGYYKFTGQRFGFKVDLKYFDETIQNKGNLQPPYKEFAFDTWFYTKRLSERFQADYRISEGRGVDIVFAHSFYNRVKNTFIKDLTTLDQLLTPDPSAHDTTKFTSFLIRGTFTDEQISEKLSYQAGTDINLETGEGKRIENGSQFIGDYAAFASLKYEPTPTISFQPGLRYGYNTKYNSPLVPSLNIRYQPSGGTHILRGSYARGFRAPSLKELYLYFVDINHNLRGNPDLQAEYSHNLNLSWDHNLEKNTNRYTFKAGAFYNSIHNRIMLARDSATLYSYINVDQYRTLGGKVNFKYTLHPRFTFQVGLFQVAYKIFADEESGTSSPFRFTTDITSSTSYNWISRNIRFLISYKYNGKQPELQFTTDGELLEGYISGYHNLDASVGKSWMNDRLMVNIGANNLFNYTNILSSGSSSGAHSGGGTGSYPAAWGRSFFVSLRYNIQKY